MFSILYYWQYTELKTVTLRFLITSADCFRFVTKKENLDHLSLKPNDI